MENKKCLKPPTSICIYIPQYIHELVVLDGYWVFECGTNMGEIVSFTFETMHNSL